MIKLIGLGAAVGHAVGVEVGEHLLLPGVEGAAEAGDLGDRAAGEGFDHLLTAAKCARPNHT
jgi:hypothetical protein